MGTRALPDMYALSPWACGPQALGIHIKQSTLAHLCLERVKRLNTYKVWHAIREYIALNNHVFV